MGILKVAPDYQFCYVCQVKPEDATVRTYARNDGVGVRVCDECARSNPPGHLSLVEP